MLKCVSCEMPAGESLKILSSNPYMPRPLNWQNLSPLLNKGQNIPAFLPLTSIFLTENSLEEQFGSASLWHIVPAARLGYFGRALKLVSEQLQKYYSL